MINKSDSRFAVVLFCQSLGVWLPTPLSPVTIVKIQDLAHQIFKNASLHQKARLEFATSRHLFATLNITRPRLFKK